MKRNIYMQAHTKEHFKYGEKYLKKLGYEWVVDGKSPTYEEMRSWFRGNAKPYLHGYYNNITDRLEIQATTKSIEATYGITL